MIPPNQSSNHSSWTQKCPFETPTTHTCPVPITSHHQNRPRAPVAVRTLQNHRNVIRRRFPSPTTIFNRSGTHMPSNQQLGPPTKHPKTYIHPTLPTQPGTCPVSQKKNDARCTAKPTFSTFFALILPHETTLLWKRRYLHLHPDPTYQNPPNRWAQFRPHPVGAVRTMASARLLSIQCTQTVELNYTISAYSTRGSLRLTLVV